VSDFLDGPKNYVFPLWRGQDSAFVVKRKDPVTGSYINYDSGTTAKVVFTAGTVEIEFPGVISGSQASFFIDDEDVEAVKHNSLWRLQFTINGSDSAPVVGKVSRKDAK
jgi:hypothetical protein